MLGGLHFTSHEAKFPTVLSLFIHPSKPSITIKFLHLMRSLYHASTSLAAKPITVLSLLTHMPPKTLRIGALQAILAL